MKKKGMKGSTKLFLGAAGSLVAGAVAFFGVAYARSGRREQDSKLIPNKLEDQIDKLVSWLDNRFGKQWVDRGLDALQTALSTSGPGMLVRILEPVFLAEVTGREKQWTGKKKLKYASTHLHQN